MNKIFKFTVFRYWDKRQHKTMVSKRKKIHNMKIQMALVTRSFKFLVEESCLEGLSCQEGWWLPQLSVRGIF